MAVWRNARPRRRKLALHERPSVGAADTLVVETINFPDAPNTLLAGIDGLNYPYGALGGSAKNLRLIERFRRVDADTLDYRFTVDDPNTWTRPWSAEIPLTATKGPLYEYACHEGNYGMPDILRGARFTEKEAARDPRR